jgi:hypothetical protein
LVHGPEAAFDFIGPVGEPTEQHTHLQSRPLGLGFEQTKLLLLGVRAKLDQVAAEYCRISQSRDQAADHWLGHAAFQLGASGSCTRLLSLQALHAVRSACSG